MVLNLLATLKWMLLISLDQPCVCIQCVFVLVYHVALFTQYLYHGCKQPMHMAGLI